MYCDTLPVSALDERVVAAEALIDGLMRSDLDLHDHCFATAILAAQILGTLGKADDECACGFIVGLLHDVGITDVGDHGQPSLPSEWLWLQRRVRRATYKIVSQVPELAAYARLAADIHFDSAWSFVSKVVIVADQYDVLTRSWAGEAPQCSLEEALEVLWRAVGWKYDARVIGALERICAEQAALP